MIRSDIFLVTVLIKLAGYLTILYRMEW